MSPFGKSLVQVRLSADVEGHGAVQGSFEMIGEMASSASVPADYLQMAEQHAAEGCYVLAMAHRWVPHHYHLGVLTRHRLLDSSAWAESAATWPRPGFRALHLEAPHSNAAKFVIYSEFILPVCPLQHRHCGAALPWLRDCIP